LNLARSTILVHDFKGGCGRKGSIEIEIGLGPDRDRSTSRRAYRRRRATDLNQRLNGPNTDAAAAACARRAAAAAKRKTHAGTIPFAFVCLGPDRLFVSWGLVVVVDFSDARGGRRPTISINVVNNSNGVPDTRP
jgi:hypothetical protein